MGPVNQNPLDELQALDEQVGQVTELAGLKPIFFRLDELARQYPGDFEVQLAVSEIKQRVVTRGSALKQLGQTMHEDNLTYAHVCCIGIRSFSSILSTGLQCRPV